MPDKWIRRFQTVRAFGWMAVAGLVLMVFAAAVPENVGAFLAIFGFLLFLPAFLYIPFATIWHWKERYRGTHSDLWGGLILLQMGGLSQLVYLIRHIVPDMGRRGRYRL